MSKFTASTVKGKNFRLTRAEGQPFYEVHKTRELEGKQSSASGFLYKDATEGSYVLNLGLLRSTHADFNAAKAYINEAIY